MRYCLHTPWERSTLAVKYGEATAGIGKAGGVHPQEGY